MSFTQNNPIIFNPEMNLNAGSGDISWPPMGEAASWVGWNPECGGFVTMKTSGAPAMPRSNQIETTLFAEGQTA
jgi:hypothetical protein